MLRFQIQGKSLFLKLIIGVALMLGLIITITIPVFGHSNRFAGETRFETARIISEAISNAQVETVILTTGYDFKDALTATVLAYQKKAPILLANTTPSNSQDAFDYIEKHMTPGGTVYIIGGTGAISGNFEVALSAKGVANIIRLGGTDQYNTNYLIVKALEAKTRTPVVITSGDNFPDALSISTFAAQNGWPILMVPAYGLTVEMTDYLEVLLPTSIYITGGYAVVPMQVEKQIQAIVPKGTIQRFAGVDRFETSAQIIKAFAPRPETIFLTTGYNFADALSGSVLAAQHGSPLVLIDPDIMEPPFPMIQYLSNLYENQVNPKVVALGGSSVVTKWILSATEKILGEGYIFSGSAPRRVDKQTVTISVVGDNTLGTDPNFGYASSFTQMFDQKGPEYFFSGVKGVFGNDDLTIANLETTFTRATKKLYKGPNGAGFFFKGDPSYTSILKAGSIEAVNVGNNHSLDFLEQGFNDTLKNLQDADVGAFGRGKSYVFEKKGISTGMLAYILLATDQAERKMIKEQIAARITELRKTCQIVVVSFHWGIENEYEPKDIQREFGHYAIDCGADMVVGHHPHVLQPIEKYKGRYIFYSLGNFSFGGNFNPWEKDTAIVQQSFHFANGELWSVSTPNVIPCSLSSISSRNDYRPQLVNGEAGARVLKKLNWP